METSSFLSRFIWHNYGGSACCNGFFSLDEFPLWKIVFLQHKYHCNSTQPPLWEHPQQQALLQGWGRCHSVSWRAWKSMETPTNKGMQECKLVHETSATPWREPKSKPGMDLGIIIEPGLYKVPLPSCDSSLEGSLCPFLAISDILLCENPCQFCDPWGVLSFWIVILANHLTAAAQHL